MKLRSEFESTRSNLLNRESTPSLDTCLNDLFREEEQRLLTQNTMEQQKSNSVPMAYAAQGKPKGRDISTVQCFCCKGFGHYASNCLKKSAATAKRMAISLKNALLDPSRNLKQHMLPQLILLVLVVLSIQHI